MELQNPDKKENGSGKQARIVLNIILFIVFFTIVQDLVCAVFFNHGTSARTLKMVYYIKEVAILLLGSYCALSLLVNWQYKIRGTEIFVTFFVIDILIYMCVGATKNGVYNALLGSRQYIIPIMMLIIGIYLGKYLYNDRILLEKTIKFIVALSVFLIITTIFERYVLSIRFWTNMNMVKFSNVVKGNVGDYASGTASLIQNFYSAGHRRAVGVAAEPLLLSYYMIPLLYINLGLSTFSTGKKERRKYLVIALGIFLCQVLTLTRAIIISEVVALGIVYIVILFKNRSLYNYKLILRLAVLGLLVAALFWNQISVMIYKTLNNLDGGSAGMHMYQLNQGLGYLKTYWYGLGVGSGSNLVATTGAETLTTEFAYSNITLDLGIFGTLCYVFLLLRYCFSFIGQIRLEKNRTIRAMYFMNAFCIMTWLITGIFSPQMWGMKSVLLTWLMIGFSRGIMRTAQERGDERA